MVVMGLGTAGANVARCFEKWPQYEVITLEVDQEIPRQSKVEAYEENTPDFSDLFKNLSSEIWFFVAGASKVAACSLATIEQIKDKKINIVHISSDPLFLSSQAKLRERVVLGVLQQYARCGLLNAIYLISNKNALEMLDGVAFSEVNAAINDAVASMVHYFNVYQNTSPLMGYKMEPSDISRIRTFGMVDIKKNEEKLFFSLDNCTEICYIYNINKTEKSNDKKIEKIKQLMEVKKPTCKTSFAMYTTEYAQSFCHAIQMTHYIQQEKQ